MTGAAPRYRLSFGKLVETFEGVEMSPIIASVARLHVPPACRADLVRFVSTGCSTDQLKMVIRYMGGTEPDLHHIEIEERQGVLHASCQMPGGINWTGNAVMVAGRLPETVAQSLPGRPLSAFVDHPLLPGEAVVSKVMTLGGILTVEAKGGLED